MQGTKAKNFEENFEDNFGVNFELNFWINFRYSYLVNKPTIKVLALSLRSLRSGPRSLQYPIQEACHRQGSQGADLQQKNLVKDSKMISVGQSR